MRIALPSGFRSEIVEPSAPTTLRLQLTDGALWVELGRYAEEVKSIAECNPNGGR